MRIPSLVFAVALLFACEKAPTRTKHNVEVKREIQENGAGLPETWSMSVDSSWIDFSRLTAKSMSDLQAGYMHTLKFRGTDGRNALSVFNTFSQWAATARANHVEQFSKRISSDCEYSMFRARNGKSIETPCDFSYKDDKVTLNDEFTEDDIAKFSELLKQLPEANAERLAKESKAEQEQNLFK